MTQNIKLTESNFRTISDLVYQHCGINLHDGKKELVRARLAKRLRECSFNFFSDYIEHLQKNRDSKEFTDFIDSLSTNLTSFFREKQHFDYLEQKFLPKIMEQKSKFSNHKIRVWSAGCSSGEEPYSLAITLLEAISQNTKWDAKILATDISTRILTKAKAGIYDEQKIGPIPTLQRNKYLAETKQNRQKLFEVNNNLRRIIAFKYLNLMKDWPFKGPLDFIFCRNVMIYFDKPTQEKLVNRFWDILEPGGLLFTGHSESLTGINHKFNYIQPTIYGK